MTFVWNNAAERNKAHASCPDIVGEIMMKIDAERTEQTARMAQDFTNVVSIIPILARGHQVQSVAFTVAMEIYPTIVRSDSSVGSERKARPLGANDCISCS